MVQPQNKKKKQSMETRATDSNAVTTPHTNSSTMETLMRPDHLINLRGDHLGVTYDATIAGHRITDDRSDNSNINQRNADAIDYSVKINLPFSQLSAVYSILEMGVGYLFVYVNYRTQGNLVIRTRG